MALMHEEEEERHEHGLFPDRNSLPGERQDNLKLSESLPYEIKEITAENLDPASLASVVQDGIIGARPDTLCRAQHAYVWTTIFQEKDFATLERRTRKYGNVFLIGYGLERLYNGIHGMNKDASPIDLIFSWDLCRSLSMKKIISTVSYNPTIRIQAGFGEAKIWVDDLGKYIKNDSGRLTTNIMYFHDEDWKLHTIEVKFQRKNDLMGTEHYFNYDIKVEKLRPKPAGYWTFDHRTLHLEQVDSYSSQKTPRSPWHLSG